MDDLVENIQAHFKKESHVEYPREVIERSLTAWLEQRYDRMLEQLGEIVTTPHLAEAQEFRQLLDANNSAHAPAAEMAAVEAATDASVFTGGAVFSPSKLGAMISYLASRGHDIYKTNLNKLLFYSDLTAYYLYGSGISGAIYLNRPFGPVPNGVENILEDLASQGDITRVDMPEVGQNAQRIFSEHVPSPQLSPDEIRVLDWVLDNYGHMSASELSELSHKEKAYKFTRPLEPIAYEYAKFFNKLPAKKAN